MEKWSGKTAIVTGASSGIGEAIVRDFVENGINVIALARRMDKLESLRDELKVSKGKVIPLKCDVSDKSSIDETFEKIAKDIGKIHILVNNAGTATNAGLLNDDPLIDDMINMTINTNFTGLVRCTRHAYRLMKKFDEYGIIINIGSIVGHKVVSADGFQLNVYPGTKHAVRAFTESIRQELVLANNSKIRVCEISPGAVQTEIINKFMDDPDFRGSVGSSMGKLKASEVSQTVLFMLTVPYTVNITEMIVKPVGEKF